MKIRYGFVSNSSSTSFCVFGVRVEDPAALCNKLLGAVKEVKTQGCSHNVDRDKVKFCPECGKPSWNIEVKTRYHEEELENYFFKNEKLGLDVVQWGGGENTDEGIYVGISLDSKKLNEAKSKAEVIKDIEDKIKAMFPSELPKFYSDAGYA